MVDEHRNVLAALAQRRHDDVNDVEAVEQVLAERALRDHVAQVAVGRRDHADVDDAAAAVGADLLQLAGLEEAQQQALHAQRHLADFVEEDRAHVGGFELARLVAIGAGEAALDVAEQLGLEQRFGQAGAVDRREHVAGARGRVWMARATISLPTPLRTAPIGLTRVLLVWFQPHHQSLFMNRSMSRRCSWVMPTNVAPMR